MELTVGNTTGQYFTEWRFDVLRDFVTTMCEEFNMVVDSPHLDYDATDDYHDLTFSTNGHVVLIRMYKVYSAYIDGEAHWQGCSRSDKWALIKSIKQACI